MLSTTKLSGKYVGHGGNRLTTNRAKPWQILAGGHVELLMMPLENSLLSSSVERDCIF